MEKSKEDLLYEIERILYTIDGVEQAIIRLRNSDDSLVTYYTQFKDIMTKKLKELFNKYNSI